MIYLFKPNYEFLCLHFLFSNYGFYLPKLNGKPLQIIDAGAAAMNQTCLIAFANSWNNHDIYSFCGNAEFRPNIKLEIKTNRVYVVTTKAVACNTEFLYDGRDCTFIVPQTAKAEHASRLFFLGGQTRMFPTRTIDYIHYIRLLQVPLNQNNRKEMLDLINLAQTKVIDKQEKEILFRSKLLLINLTQNMTIFK